MKTFSVFLLWLSIAAECCWIAAGQHPGSSWIGAVGYPLVLVVAFSALAATKSRTRWIPAIVRIFISYEFLNSVADRLGLRGGPGTHGVSWGDFGHFVTSTRQINSFLPGSFALPLAVAATIAEALFGLGLLVGFKIKLTSRLSAGLLLMFAVAMTISLPAVYQFMFGVFVMAAGAFVISTVDASFLSIDSALGKKRPASSKR